MKPPIHMVYFATIKKENSTLKIYIPSSIKNTLQLKKGQRIMVKIYNGLEGMI